MSNLGRWATWYGDGTAPSRPYADQATYWHAERHLQWLAVEDWGCGFAWFRTVHAGPYLGVDGTPGYADVVDDLTTRRSATPGLLLRHVLEHNTDWPAVLANAVASATERLVIVTFVPDGDGQQVGWTHGIDVPDIAVPHAAVDAALAGWTVEKTTLATATQYRTETVWCASR